MLLLPSRTSACTTRFTMFGSVPTSKMYEIAPAGPVRYALATDSVGFFVAIVAPSAGSSRTGG